MKQIKIILLHKYQKKLKLDRHYINGALGKYKRSENTLDIYKKIATINVDKLCNELKNNKDKTIKNPVIALHRKQVSIYKIADILKVEFPTVLKALNCSFKYNKGKTKNYIYRNNIKVTKLKEDVIKMFLQRNQMSKIAEELNIDYRTVEKYIRYELNKFVKH